MRPPAFWNASRGRHGLLMLVRRGLRIYMGGGTFVINVAGFHLVLISIHVFINQAFEHDRRLGR